MGTGFVRFYPRLIPGKKFSHFQTRKSPFTDSDLFVREKIEMSDEPRKKEEPQKNFSVADISLTAVI